MKEIEKLEERIDNFVLTNFRYPSLCVMNTNEGMALVTELQITKKVLQHPLSYKQVRLIFSLDLENGEVLIA